MVWPPDACGTAPRRRVMFFTDLHWEGGHPEGAAALRQVAAAWQPHWTLFGGDLTRYASDEAGASAVLRELCGTDGSVAVLGNRETSPHRQGAAAWRRLYADAGYRLLVNEALEVIPGDLSIAGIDEPRHGTPDPQAVLATRTTRYLLLLSHNPDAIVDATGLTAPALALCGHTHGGQIRLPVIGALHTSSRYWRQFDRGLFENEYGGRMLVSTGCGVTGPGLLRRRIRCPGEVVLISWSPDPRPETTEQP